MSSRRQARCYALLYILLHSYMATATYVPDSTISRRLPKWGDDLNSIKTTELGASHDLNDPSPNFLMSWLLGVLWGDDSTVSVVDRSPILGFHARPAAFGPTSDVLGYMVKVEDFSAPCGDEDSFKGNGTDGNVPLHDGGGNDGDGGESPDKDHGRKYPWDEVVSWKSNLRQGCPPICFNGNKRPEFSETWIALVMRGGCTFVEKIREAQRLGAKGVVVGGENAAQDSHGDGLVQMYSLEDSSDVKIPSVYITHESYRSLSSLISSSNTSTSGFKTVSAVITIDVAGWQWYSPILTFLLLLFLPSILTLFTLLIHRCRAARAARRERAPEEVVQNLPWSVWEGQQTVRELEKGLQAAVKTERKSSHSQSSQEQDRPDADAATESRTVGPESSAMPSQHVSSSQFRGAEAKRWFERQVECAICLEEFVKGDKVRVLPCRHIFHMEEVDDWLIHRKKVCPICKHDVTLPLDIESPITREPGIVPEPLSTIPQTDTEPTERTPLLT